MNTSRFLWWLLRGREEPGDDGNPFANARSLVAIDIDLFQPEELQSLARLFKRIRIDRRCIVYLTREIQQDAREFITEHGLAAPDFLISDAGWRLADGQSGKELPDWQQQPAVGWCPERVAEWFADRKDFMNGAKGGSFERPRYYLVGRPMTELASIQQQLFQCGIHASLLGGIAATVDVTPINKTFGHAIAHLLATLQIPPNQAIVVAWQSLAPDLFDMDFRYVLASRCSHERGVRISSNTYQPSLAGIDGLIEGVKHWAEEIHQDSWEQSFWAVTRALDDYHQMFRTAH